MQEGRAGCCGRSGLATGTENRREMKGGKRGREKHSKWGGGRGRGGPPGDTSVAGPAQQEGLRQQMLLPGVALGRGRKGDYAKVTVTSQRTEGREEGKVPEQARSGHRNIKDQHKCLCARAPGTSINAGESPA